MKKRYKITILSLAFSTLVGCVSLNKIQYLEPYDKADTTWHGRWVRDALFSSYNIDKYVKDTIGNNCGSIKLTFQDNERLASKPTALFFEVTIKAIDRHFMNHINLDSTIAFKKGDSLQKRGISTGKALPYNRFFLIDADSNCYPVKLSEHFSNESITNRRSFNVYCKGAFKNHTKIKIVTGDAYLDNILGSTSFVVKTKKKIYIMTTMN